MTEPANPRWGTPSFDRPDIIYECSGCDTVVNPTKGDKQAALLIAGRTVKVCASCADRLDAQIREGYDA